VVQERCLVSSGYVRIAATCWVGAIELTIIALISGA
jgi:hypothetical protein